MVHVRTIDIIVSDGRHPPLPMLPLTTTAIRHRSHPIDDDCSSVDGNRHRHPPLAVAGGGRGGGCDHCHHRQQHGYHLSLPLLPLMTTAIRHCSRFVNTTAHPWKMTIIVVLYRPSLEGVRVTIATICWPALGRRDVGVHHGIH